MTRIISAPPQSAAVVVAQQLTTAAPALDAAGANIAYLDMSGDTDITISGIPPSGGTTQVTVVNSGAGAYRLGWPDNMAWAKRVIDDPILEPGDQRVYTISLGATHTILEVR